MFLQALHRHRQFVSWTQVFSVLLTTVQQPNAAALVFPTVEAAASASLLPEVPTIPAKPAGTLAAPLRRAVPLISPPVISATLPDVPTATDISHFRVFDRPLVASNSGTDEERRSLGRLLERLVATAGHENESWSSQINQWVQDHQRSSWTPALQLELANLYRKEGNHAAGLSLYRQAWAAMERSKPGTAMGDRAQVAFAALAETALDLGQTAEVANLEASWKGKPVSAISAERLSRVAIERQWRSTHPVESSLCGVAAYNVLAGKLGLDRIESSQCCGRAGVDLTEAEKKDLADHGMKATMLRHLVTEAAGSDWRWVRNTDVAAPPPSPAVAHLKFGEQGGHYVAVMAVDGAGVTIAGMPNSGSSHIPLKTFLSQSTGFYLVPERASSDGLVLASEKDLASVAGRDSSGCPQPGDIITLWNGQTAELMAYWGDCPPEDDEGQDPDSCNKCKGMAVYNFNDSMASLLVNDSPLSYEPEYGPKINWQVQYRQIDQNFMADWDGSVVSATSTIGSHWSHSFLSYVRAKDGGSLPLQSAGRGYLSVVQNGAHFDYTYNNSNGTFQSRYTSRPKLESILSGGSTIGYKLSYDDGSYSEFKQPDGVIIRRYLITRTVDAQGQELNFRYDTHYRLAMIEDATANPAIPLDPENPATWVGRTIFGYNSETDMLIRSITDPLGRTATFGYQGTGAGALLTSITDPLGIQSSFTYQDGYPNRLDSLVTPYGATYFSYEGSVSPQSDSWSVTATEANGLQSKVARKTLEAGVAAAIRSEPVPPSTAGSTTASGFSFIPPNLSVGRHRITLNWNRKQMREYAKAKALNPTVDPDLYAETTIWMVGNDYRLRDVPAVIKTPGTSARWFNYPGQTSALPWTVGTDDQMVKQARQVEDATGAVKWVMTQQSYNTGGLPVVTTDEIGHKTQKVYFTTNYNNDATWGTTVAGRDVVREQVWNGSAWLELRTYGKYADGLPGKITEASGKVTTLIRNAQHQVTEQWVSKGSTIEKTRYTYDTDGQGTPDGQPGYLMKVERTNPIYTSHPTGTDSASYWVTLAQYSYTFPASASGVISQVKVVQETDSSGYTRTMTHDVFDRLKTVAYPDGTTEEYVYSHGQGPAIGPGLDLTAAKDRAGRWTQTIYNSLRQPVIQTTPDGLSVKYDWCSCGAMSTLTDKAGRVTQWKRDILGRVYEKVMPDNTTKTTYTYQAQSGRLATVTKPNQQGTGTPTVTYSYNLNGTLAKEDYLGTDCDATYTYDVVDRVSTVVDATGTHSYTYNALPAAGTTGTLDGAGALATYNSPLANATLSYAYDWQNRRDTTTLKSDSGTVQRSEALVWDALGRAKTVTNALGTFTYGYTTSLARPDTLTSPAVGTSSIVTTYSYYDNAAGAGNAQRLKSIYHKLGTNTYPYSGHEFGYTVAGLINNWRHVLNYSPAGSQTIVPTRDVFDYNASDELTAQRRWTYESSFSNQVDTWSYDEAGNWTAKGTQSALSTRHHDVMNRLTGIGGAGTTTVDGTLNEAAQVKVNGQDVPLQASNHIFTSSPSPYAFRSEVAVAEGQNTITIQATDQDNQVTIKTYQFNVAPLSRSFTYDANGNMLTDSSNGSTQRTFTWDVKNRLKTVTVSGITYRWDYDHQDRRVREYQYTAGGTVPSYPGRLFIWDGTAIIAERSVSSSSNYTAGGTTARTHFFGGFMDGSPTVSTSPKYLTYGDHLGNIRDIIALNAGAGTIGAVISRYEYKASQAPVKINTGGVDASLLTIGRYYHHAASGLEMALYRAYDPELGRWIGEDPLEEEGGLNLYQYVHNIPTTRIDALGLADFPEISPGGADLHMHVGGRKGGRAYNIRPDATLGVKACPRGPHAMPPNAPKHLSDALKDPTMLSKMRKLVSSTWDTVNSPSVKEALEALGRGLRRGVKCATMLERLNPYLLLLEEIELLDEDAQRNDPA